MVCRKPHSLPLPAPFSPRPLAMIHGVSRFQFYISSIKSPTSPLPCQPCEGGGCAWPWAAAPSLWASQPPPQPKPQPRSAVCTAVWGALAPASLTPVGRPRLGGRRQGDVPRARHARSQGDRHGALSSVCVCDTRSPSAREGLGPRTPQPGGPSRPAGTPVCACSPTSACPRSLFSM